jgi:hypothetical protein
MLTGRYGMWRAWPPAGSSASTPGTSSAGPSSTPLPSSLVLFFVFLSFFPPLVLLLSLLILFLFLLLLFPSSPSPLPPGLLLPSLPDLYFLPLLTAIPPLPLPPSSLPLSSALLFS